MHRPFPGKKKKSYWKLSRSFAGEPLLHIVFQTKDICQHYYNYCTTKPYGDVDTFPDSFRVLGEEVVAGTSAFKSFVWRERNNHHKKQHHHKEEEQHHADKDVFKLRALYERLFNDLDEVTAGGCGWWGGDALEKNLLRAVQRFPKWGSTWGFGTVIWMYAIYDFASVLTEHNKNCFAKNG